LFEFACVGIELANPFTQLVNCHRILIVHPAERLLIQLKPLSLTGPGLLRSQSRRDLALRFPCCSGRPRRGPAKLLFALRWERAASAW
jgi:hypothetical protein